MAFRSFTRFRDALQEYRVELRHLTILLLVLVAFQYIVLFINQQSMRDLSDDSRRWYQQDAAERIANLTSTSIELLLTSTTGEAHSDVESRQIIQEFNIIFSQQLLDKNVQGTCLVIPQADSLVTIDDGAEIFRRFYRADATGGRPAVNHDEAVRWYRTIEERIRKSEQTTTVVEEPGVFHVFVPFVPQGEFVGALYMKSTPDLSALTTSLSEGIDVTALVYAALIISGLLAMFYVSARTVRERDEAQRMLFDEQKQHLADQINHQKEMVFTKRLYHAHHKAEKIGGFVKEDLRSMHPGNMDELRERIGKYTSFVARVIYDMKWYDPPIQTFRGPMFDTDVNAVIRFLVEHVFRRVSGGDSTAEFRMELDPSMPRLAVNEFVVWEVVEPVIQNSLDHAGRERPVVTIRTEGRGDSAVARIIVRDDGVGVPPELMERDRSGVRRIFLEHVSEARSGEKQHSGYGCYIAHEIATQRLGWGLDAENLVSGGCQFTFTVPV